MKRKTKKLAAVKAENTANRTVITIDSPDGIFIEGVGNWNYTCPHCDALIADGVGRFQIQKIVVRCKCGKFSAFPEKTHDDA